MPINQTANLLAYFQQNAPMSSQTVPVNSLTYPPIPNAIGAFAPTALTDMSINSTLVSPFSTLPISGLTVLNSPATIGTFTPPQFATGVPGTMTYNNAYTTPHLPQPAVQPFTPTSTLLGLGQGVPTPPNNLTPITTLAAGDNPSWRGNTISALGLSDFFVNTEATGFTTNFQTGTPSNFVGIAGTAGSMTYTKPTVLTSLYDSVYNASKKYIDQPRRYASDIKLDTAFNTTRNVSWAHESSDYTLSKIYKAGNFKSVKTKFESFNKPYVTRGIQKDTPEDWSPKDLPGSADEHMVRLLAAKGDSGFVDRRKMLRNFQFQSRFQLGLGILPHLFFGGPMAGGNLNFKQTGLIDSLAAKAWIKGGTIAKVPHHLINYSVLNSLALKYGISPKGDGIWKALGNLLGKLEIANEDLIPFYFEILHKTKPEVQGLFNQKGILQFRGTIKTLSHSLTPQWSAKKYFGRPDSVHTYSGFGQNFSFSFSAYAVSRSEMLALYRNINELMDLTKPGWDSTKSYMIGPVTKLTIGDYITEQPGYISSLSISPDESIYWDIGKNPIRGLPQIAQVVPQGLIDGVIPPILGGNLGINDKKLPRAFNISITYTVIEKDIPDADGTRFWNTEGLFNGGDYQWHI